MPDRELRYSLRLTDLDSFLKMSVKERLRFLDRGIISENGDFRGDKDPYHFMYSQSFSKEVIFSLCRLAETIRQLQKRKDDVVWLQQLLPHKKAIGVFNQMSSRTRMSFVTAAGLLGMQVNILDLSTSSAGKGESWLDTIDTLSAYSDTLFIRHAGRLHLEEAVWASNQTEGRIPIINAGSGPDDGSGTYQHPTQTLLDIYTLWRSFENCGGMNGRIFAFCGDLNARVARSLIYASRHFPPKKIYLICPPGRELKDDMIEFLDKRGIAYEYIENLEDVVEIADVVYMIRIQDEYDKTTADKALPLENKYKFKWRYRDRIKKSARVLHALPKRDEIDQRYDYADDPHHQFVYKAYQMKNGVWMRAAIFAHIFGISDEIFTYHKRQFG